MTACHLYIHVPFCARRCAYCDFSIAVRRIAPVDEFVGGLQKEIAQKADSIGELDTLYLGGGTPSRLGPEGLARTVSLIRDRFRFSDNIELTIEANPDDVTPDAARQWREAGVNRVSLGVQSFDDSVLKWMHRIHDASAAIRSFETLREAGFDNISIDLIFALPDSLNRSWERDLEQAIRLRPEHVSLYGLTIEPATPLGRWSTRGAVKPADEDKYAREFLLADEMMIRAGYEHYEVSNFGLPGKGSRHNSAYWEGVPYIGIGPSAHSFDGARRSWNVAPYAQWVEKLGRNESIIEDSELLSESNRRAEKVYLGLRTRAGLAIGAQDRESASAWSREGWAVVDGDTVRLTSEGWLRLDSLAAALTGF
ncbi:MAG TPA: radical SAM family heme chaperone HemW [Gemmatimonadaceae bacterium]